MIRDLASRIHRHCGIALGVALMLPGNLAAGECGFNEPGFPVPECVSSSTGLEVACSASDAVQLWPAGWRPGEPGERFPLDRDSTQWRSFSIPGANSGHELFRSLDIVENHLYVAYNAGVQVWNIAGNNAEDPNRLFNPDGYRGQFFDFPPSGENDFWIDDIDAINPSGGNSNVLVALTGKDGVGFSIWDHRKDVNLMTQLYQDLGTDTRTVEALEFNNTAYAFTGSFTGAYVYNLSQARNLTGDCLDDKGSVCPGIYRGSVGTLNKGYYMSVIERNNRIYLASTGGTATTLEIWEMSDPSNPGSAVRRFSETSINSRGVEFFLRGAVYYLAVIESSGSTKTLKIYNASNCLDTNGCTSLGSPVWQRVLPAWSANFQWLTYTESNGTPYLFYGFESVNMEGDAIEQLYDLTTLGTTNQITEITDGGGSFTDACNGQTVDYWGYYYPKNDHGLRNTSPHMGKFNGDYFYRIGFGYLDVHVRGDGGGGTPVNTAAVSSNPPYYFGDGINFTASATNCPGSENWNWTASDTNATGLGANDQTATINWATCGTNDCPDKTITVQAVKDACSTDPNLVVNPVTINVVDPQPRIRQINISPPDVANEYPVCTVLNFNANIDGRNPFGYTWEAKDQTGMVLASSNTAAFIWDTSDVVLGPPPAEIFADGFESGDTVAWSSTVGGLPDAPGGPQKGLTELRRWIAEKIETEGSALFDIELTATNGDGSDFDSVSVTLNALGTLQFTPGTDAISVTDLGGGSYNFTANTENATEWRWEFEDPANGTSTCDFGAEGGSVGCTILGFGADDNTTSYTWTTPNTPGTFNVRVTAQNCTPETPIIATVPVVVDTIDNPDPPDITGFDVDDADCTCIGALGVCDCPVSTPITFAVTETGDPTTYDVDWDGDGTFDSIGLPANGTVTNTFTSLGTFVPRIRAVSGGQQSTTFLCESDVQILP